MFELVGDSPTTVANVGEGPGCLDLSFTCNTWRAKNLPPPPSQFFSARKEPPSLQVIHEHEIGRHYSPWWFWDLQILLESVNIFMNIMSLFHHLCQICEDHQNVHSAGFFHQKLPLYCRRQCMCEMNEALVVVLWLVLKSTPKFLKQVVKFWFFLVTTFFVPWLYWYKLID